jgi:hypothetical protein
MTYMQMGGRYKNGSWRQSIGGCGLDSCGSGQLQMAGSRKPGTVDPQVTTGLTNEQLGLWPKFQFWLTTKVLSYNPNVGQGQNVYVLVRL